MIMRRQRIAENQADIRNTPLDKYYKIFYESYLKYHKNTIILKNYEGKYVTQPR